MTKEPILCWVTALKAEAKPIIDRLNMKKHNAFSAFGFDVFICPNEQNYLIISGVGKIRSATAVTWLASKLEIHDHQLLWLNFGIAGNAEAAIGSIYRAGRIREQSTERSWYPNEPIPKKCRATAIQLAELLTVDQPCFDYPDAKWFVEMEAAGFIATAARFTELQWVKCYKVISDNRNSNPQAIKPAFVEQLCHQALPPIFEELNHWQTLATEHLSRAPKLDCTPILTKYHFSVTEQHQLRRLLHRAIVLNQLHLDTYHHWATNHPAQTGKQLLQSLRELLADTERTEN